MAVSPSATDIAALPSILGSKANRGVGDSAGPDKLDVVNAPLETEAAAGTEKGHTGKNSAMLTAGIIIADVVGAGILGMPAAVAKFGWLLSAFLLSVMLLANVHTSMLMWRVRMACPGANNYRDLVDAAFANAPPFQRRLATLLTIFSQHLFLFGILGLYLLSAGQGLGMALNQLHMCLPQWTLVACAILMPVVCTAREMGKYPSLVWINILTVIGTVAISLGYLMSQGVDESRPEGSNIDAISRNLSPAGALSGLSTFTFAMTSQIIIPEIISEMKDPAELPKAYAVISAPFQYTAFLVAGIGGYWLIGDKAVGMINANLPFGSFFQVAACCLAVHMLVSYMIKSVVFCGIVQRVVDPAYANADDKSLRARFSWALVALSVMGSAWLLANMVPFFGDAVDLLGASLTPLACWVLPIAMFTRHYKDSGKDAPRVSVAEWVLITCELALAAILMIWGTYSSMQHIVAQWHTYGAPFECHCEGLWQTCACSAEHIGMEFCDLSAGN